MSQPTDTLHAPSLDKDWTEAFIKEARLHDIPNAVIESTLDEAAVSVRRSGQSVHEIYGDPTDYATEIGESEMPAPLALLASAIGPILMQVLGVLLIAFAAFRPEKAGNIPVTWGSIIAFALIAVLYITLASRTLCTWVMRGLMARPIVSIVSVLIYLAAVIYAATIPGVYFSIPVTVAIVIGSILVGIGLIWGVMRGMDQRSQALEEGNQQGGLLLPYVIIPVIAVVFLILHFVL